MNITMKLLKTLLLCIPLCLAPLALAGDAATQKIAMIVSDLNHFPSDEEKETLAMIASDEDTSDATKTIANALANMQHKVSADDKAALEKVVAEADTSDAEKKLAKVLMGINHKPSADDLAVLETIK